ncbi:unnamed protein product [Linum tenue]|uniref:Uncharacterized protein n=1 Tax=Linum tenue TaxID=586396 RepID=A0AAV0IK63_9ROSI|nr:unnamed protein product [Linum tenue]
MDTRNADYEESYSFSDMFGTICNCSVETLKIRSVCIDGGFVSSSFGMLTSLVLEECQLIFDKGADFFACCPSLKNLVISYCIDHFSGEEKGLKIYGPQLLSLNLDSPACFDIELVAPRLRFFGVHNSLYYQKFSKLSVPALDHVEIWVDGFDGMREDDNEWTAQCFISLFRDVNNATSLMLDSYTIQVMSGVSEFLERQPSPFRRLKSLMVKADSIPFRLANCFLKGSSCMNPNVEFVRTCYFII